jgi:quercetin dioxygenase-like cupin family protein
MEVTPSEARGAIPPPAEYFTGTVQMERLPDAPAPASLRSVVVTFSPGGRTNWHTHPLGQTLYILSGFGLAQRRGGPVMALRPGDHVWFEPGEEHWHGAGPKTVMCHLAMQESQDSKAVDWLEPVGAADYGSWQG